MSNIRIVKIEPSEMSVDMLRKLLNYNIKPADFTVFYDDYTEILYVNPSVDDETVSLVMDYLTYTGEYIGEEEIFDRLLELLGGYTYNSLEAGYDRRQGRIKTNAAESKAEEIIPMIEKDLSQGGNHMVEFDEFLIGAMQRKGRSRGWKTAYNIVNYGAVYVFYLGYLMGKGIVPEDGKRKAVEA